MSASDLEDAKMDEPIMLTSAKVSATIIGGENIWKQPNIPIDTLFHWGAYDNPLKMTTANLIRLQAEYRILDSVG